MRGEKGGRRFSTKSQWKSFGKVLTIFCGSRTSQHFMVEHKLKCAVHWQLSCPKTGASLCIKINVIHHHQQISMAMVAPSLVLFSYLDAKWKCYLVTPGVQILKSSLFRGICLVPWAIPMTWSRLIKSSWFHNICFWLERTPVSRDSWSGQFLTLETHLKDIGDFTTCEIMLDVWPLYCRVAGIFSRCDDWISL